MKRVFIISQEAIFGRGIESLLQDMPGIELVGNEADLQEAVKHLHKAAPDVVILYGSFPPDRLTPAMQWVLTQDNRAKIIRLSPEDNSLGLYYTERRDVRDLDDLVNAITNDP